jgi:hypothetical protein
LIYLCDHWRPASAGFAWHRAVARRSRIWGEMWILPARRHPISVSGTHREVGTDVTLLDLVLDLLYNSFKRFCLQDRRQRAIDGGNRGVLPKGNELKAGSNSAS